MQECRNVGSRVEVPAVEGHLASPRALPVPREGERPTVYADRIGERYVASKSNRHRKEHGLYLTPIPAAEFMAEWIKTRGRKLRILDPAAGAGVLCCAAVEELVSRNLKPRAIELVAHEVDEDLIDPLRAVLDCLADWCRARGVALTVRVEAADFILAHAGALQSFGGTPSFRADAERFDIVISNPPYFKIGKADPRAVAASAVVHGQPNIYALFMAVGAALLRAGGDFVFITPRSFASGPYFRRFRTVFFDMIRPTEIHVFGSRREAFVRDEVLQENVILAGIRRNRKSPAIDGSPLVISSSRGVGDIAEAVRREVPASRVFESENRVLRLPVRDEDDEALALVGSWPSSLRDFGLNVSTGPVIPFRAAKLIGTENEAPSSHAPLLWMNNVRALRTTWPLNRRKPEHIRRSGAGPLLLPNRNYVLLRRFSAKEEPRRLTAAPWLASEFAVPEIGIENHLNYIHRRGGTLSEDEAWGLAALYNSRLLDTWFRAVNGNTQVSATELRAMPHPAHGTIVALGQHVKRLADPMKVLDALVMDLVGRAGLKEVAAGGR